MINYSFYKNKSSEINFIVTSIPDTKLTYLYERMGLSYNDSITRSSFLLANFRLLL